MVCGTPPAWRAAAMSIQSGLASWLRLTLTPGLGSSRLRDLLRRFGLPDQVLSAQRSQVAAIVGEHIAAAMEAETLRAAVDGALHWAGAPENHIITLADETYPRLLLETADPPALLYCSGKLDYLHNPALAIVGSRNATAQGARDAEAFAGSLGRAGFTIVSGLALGIDSAAHLGALDTECSTIAVLGAGVNVVYPAANAPLYKLIRQRGLLVSEFPLGSPPIARNFPRRNRVISGLSLGCLVIEAAPASGSLVTARTAAEQGREVFALPGSIHAPLSKGCHILIKSGAKLVESAEDVLVELGGHQGYLPRPLSNKAVTHPPTEPLLNQMGHAPIDIDSLSLRSGLPAERVSTELLRLELAGQVASLPGGLYQRLS